MRTSTPARFDRRASILGSLAGLVLLSAATVASAQGGIPISPTGAITDPTPTYTWQAGANAKEYRIELHTAPWWEATVVYRRTYSAASVCTGSACSATPSDVVSIGAYDWYLLTTLQDGSESWSTRLGFSVAGLPPPVQLAPSGLLGTLRPTYRWQPVAEAVSYVLQVDDETPATVLRARFAASEVCSATECAVTPAHLEGGPHRWYVLANSGAGDGPMSGGMRFVTPTWGGGRGCRGVYVPADFTGDGRTDRLCSEDGVTNVAVSTGDGFASPAAWLDQELGTPVVGDFDGDGAADLAQYDGTATVFRVALSTGTSFAPFAVWGTATAPWTDGRTYGCGNTGSARSGTGNFDGNGYADVYCRGDGGAKIFVGKSTGSAFTFSIFAQYSCWGVYERAGPADFDGDGRDDWYCVDGYGGLYGRLSNGQAFEDMSFQGPGRGVCERDDWTLVDINSDGRTDATCRPNGYVGLSTGSAILDTGSAGGWCNSYETIPDPEDPEQTIEVLRSRMQPMDTDGDRSPELVCTFDGRYVRDVTVRKWDGERLGPPQLLASQWCRTAVQGGDFDGDGQFELVCDTGAVLRASTPNVVPDLMVETTNGIGGKTTAGYTPSTSYGCNKPPVRQVLGSLTAHDGREGTSTTTYTYCDGRMDPGEAAFLGYGQVLTKAPCLDGESACPVTTTLYSQEMRSLGRPTLGRRSDGAGYTLQETQTFFHPQSGPFLPRQALVKEVRITDFGPSGNETKTTAVSYEYDDYANVTKQTSHGEVARDGTEIANDELRTAFTYEPPHSESYVVNLVSLTEQSEQRGDGWTLLKRIGRGHDPASFDLKSVTTSVLPGGGELQRTMDHYGDGSLEYVKSELGAETTVTYTEDGLHPETVTGPEGTVTTRWHPLCGAPTEVTDPNGVTRTSYDELCRPHRTDGPLGAFAERFYENLGDPGTQHVRIETPGSGGVDYSETYFDGLGRTYRSRSRGPSPGQDILTETTYNRRGAPESATEPFYDGDEPDISRYSYDPFDRVRTITHPDLSTTTKSYDLWKETTTDAKGKAVTVERATTSSVEKTTIEGEPVTTTHRYDLLGRRETLVDTLGNTWTWSYDSLDRVLLQLDPDSGARTFDYDDANRRQSETDAESHVVRVEYDVLGRVSKKTSAVGEATFRYSEPRRGAKNWGRLTTVVSPGSTPTAPPTTLSIDYDALGRVARQGRTIPEAAFRGTIQRGYDPAGRVTSLRYPDGETIRPITYDEAGRVFSIPGILQSVTYDAAGRPLEQVNANGTVTTRTYVPHRGLLDRLQTTHPATGVIQSLDYGYDDDLPLVDTVASPFPGEGWDYGYDDGYRMDEARSLSDPADVQTFDYDSIGRIRFNSRLGAYDYPEPGQARPHAPKTVNGAPYDYFANGNLKSGGGRAPTWDAEGRVAAIGTARFSYDALGERLTKTSPQGTSLYPFGDDYEVTNGVVTKYISAEGLGVVAKRVGRSGRGSSLGARTYWLHTDRLGSIQAVTSDGLDPDEPAGTVIFRKSYRPYGETLEETGTHTESRGWIDQRNDGETGLTYLHARYFDPKLGTFLSPDPIGVRGGLNLYGYGLGDPMNRTDRWGLKTACVRDVLGWTREGDKTFYGGTYCYTWGDEKMNAPTTTPDPGMPRGPEQPIGGDPGGRRPGDGRQPGDGQQNPDGAGCTTGNCGDSSGQTEPPPPFTPKTYPIVVVSVGGGYVWAAGEGGSVFVLDPETDMVYEYFYLGAGLGLGIGGNGAVEGGVMDLVAPNDVLGWGLSASAFAAVGPKGAAVSYSGNSIFGNGSSGGTAGWAGGGGFGVSGLGTYTWRMGQFPIGRAPRVVRDAFGRMRR